MHRAACPCRRQLLGLGLGLGTALGLPAARAGTAGSTLMLGGEAAPPYAIEGGGGSGLHLALCRAALGSLGLSMQWQAMPWRRALADLESGQLDGVVGATRGHLNEREALMAFPDEPLSWTHNVFVSLRSRPLHFDGLFTLRGLRIAVLAGYQYRPDFMAAAYFQRQPAAHHAQSLRMLLAGRVDAALVEVATARTLIRKLGLGDKLQLDATAIAPGRLYLGLSRQRGQARWAEPVSAALRAFKRGPAFAALLAQVGLQASDVSEPPA